MKKVLLTGAAGFIGSNLHAKLISQNFNVFAVDDFSNGSEVFIPDGNFCLKSDFADCRILDMIKQKQFDVVVHLAAMPRVSYSIHHPLQTHCTNVTKTMSLIDACKYNVESFVFASSSSVYGEMLESHSEKGMNEQLPCHPKSPYALQKLIIENYLRLYSELYGLRSASLRFFNVFGPNQLGSSPYACAIASWLTAIHKNEPLISNGDGEQTRDLCYVDNVTDACINAIDKMSTTNLNGTPINVGSGVSYSNNEIISYLKAKFQNIEIKNESERPGDVRHTLADVTKASELINYNSKISLWEGIDIMADWYENNQDLVTSSKLKM